MEPKVYGWFDRPDEIDGQEKFPEYESTVETTGYEDLKKTIDRAMIAGMRLYDTNRNIDVNDLYELQESKPAYMEKYKDAQDVNMRYREIMARLKRKVGVKANNIAPSEGPAPIVTPEPEGN